MHSVIQVAGHTGGHVVRQSAHSQAVRLPVSVAGGHTGKQQSYRQAGRKLDI